MTDWYKPAVTLGGDFVLAPSNVCEGAVIALSANPRVAMTTAKGVV